MQRTVWNEAAAAVYDDSTGREFDPAVIDRSVEVLAGLAGDGAALEFAVGTGRLALPLAARGVRVAGVDSSSPMVERLRVKDADAAIEVTIGDMTNARVDGLFSLVYLVFNGIGNLLSQDEQVACFENAAAHLEPGGCFLIESGVPGLRRLPPGAQAEVFATRPGYVGYDLYVDLAAQLAASHHVVTGDAEVREFVSPFRYVWPSELDLMARVAGMKLRSRWADWDASPFTGESPSHVSIWEKSKA